MKSDKLKDDCNANGHALAEMCNDGFIRASGDTGHLSSSLRGSSSGRTTRSRKSTLGTIMGSDGSDNGSENGSMTPIESTTKPSNQGKLY